MRGRLEPRRGRRGMPIPRKFRRSFSLRSPVTSMQTIVKTIDNDNSWWVTKCYAARLSLSCGSESSHVCQKGLQQRRGD